MPRLMTKPEELQLRILSFVTSNRDKNSICKVCKTLCRLCTPVLCKTCTISPYRLHSGFSSTLVNNHRGIPHIRTLRIVPEGDGFYVANLSERALEVLIHLVEVIPRDRLTRFELPTLDTLTGVLHRTLRLRQHNLTNYLHHAIYNIHAVPSNVELSRVTCLQLYLGLPNDLARAARLIETVPDMRTLEFHFTPDFGALRINDQRRLMGTLFGQVQGARKCHKLESLRVICEGSFVDVCPLATLVTFNHLKDLHLEGCEAIDDLLDHLSSLSLDLHTFSIYRTYTHYLALKRFFQSLRSPKRLVIDTWGDDCRDWVTLLPFAANLESLEIASDDSIPCAFEIGAKQPNFTTFCATASRLEKLDLGGVTVQYESWESPNGLLAALDCIKQLHASRYLHISACDAAAAAAAENDEDNDVEERDYDDHDDNDYDIDECIRLSNRIDAPDSFHMGNDELEIAAHQIFKTPAPSCPKLNVVCLAVALDPIAFQHRCAAFLRKLKKNEDNTPAAYEYVIERIPHDEIKQYDTISESVARKYITWQESE